MKLVKLLMLLIVGNIVFAEITGKIIVRGKWGFGEGEFGLDTTEPPGAGPSVFTVSPPGNVYIADFVNKRIVVYAHFGNLLRSFNVSGRVNNIDVDDDNYIYYTSGKGLVVFDNNGEIMATSDKNGRIRVECNDIYLWGKDSTYIFLFDKKTNELKTNRMLSGFTTISNGFEFRKGPTALSKETGIAHITINGKPIPIKKIVKGKEEPARIDSTDIFSDLSRYFILDGDCEGNVYMCHYDNVVRINSQGILTGKFVPTNDDLRFFGLPYSASGYMRVKNGKIYTMGSTDDEFMIIEYEFQPVGDTVGVKNEGDGVKKNTNE